MWCNLQNDWKLAAVALSPKKSDSTKPDNLIPISLLPVTGKILEHFMNKRIIASNH